MKKSDLAMIILISGICAVAAFAVASNIPILKASREGVTVRTIEPISSQVSSPSQEVFNSNAINPTIQVVVGGGQGGQEQVQIEQGSAEQGF